ncbi:MAG TPA: TIGR00282 family metallophosphoesterase [Firmicutes bacterium]|nr:TIGR00282 family metallophosphoesterase [Bacillota bacterium]
MIRILFIGDIIGKPGREAVSALLPGLIKEKEITFTIANGENTAGGFGITPDMFRKLDSYGIDAVTTGNHIRDKREIFPFLALEPRLLRPHNLPPGNSGTGIGVYEIQKGSRSISIGVLNLSGRIFMDPLNDDPFRTADKALGELKDRAKIIFVDFHAEATSEKYALACYLDGRITAFAGTHTHVQTADEKILGKGTGYITDAGMTGPFDSVIGVKKEMVIKRFLTGHSEKFETAKGLVRFNGIIYTIDEESGKTTGVERLDIAYDKE